MKAEKGRVSIMTKQQKKTLNLVLTYLVIILIGCVLLFPIAWMISAAFKTNDEIFGSIALLPKSFSFQNFIDGWKSAGIYTYATYFINSFIMVIPTTLLTIASSALVAYGFARFNFPFKKQLFAILFSTQERTVLDWSGFAGCWFAPALVYLYRLTGEERCLHSAEKALDYYHTFVKDLNCYGTPMDTWKAVDEEGNLAFMRGSRLLYEQTGKAEFLQYMKDSAGYEFLWRYGYKTYPEHTPLNQGWSACGGAVTSVSNPHIHPMGVIIDTDLRYLARVTGDGYYASRAADSAAWMLQCLELYPAATGYGRYGILSERWCPSDGLDVERFSDGRPFSSWFSHNLWASACVLEAACELLLEIEHKKG